MKSTPQAGPVMGLAFSGSQKLCFLQGGLQIPQDPLLLRGDGCPVAYGPTGTASSLLLSQDQPQVALSTPEEPSVDLPTPLAGCSVASILSAHLSNPKQSHRKAGTLMPTPSRVVAWVCLLPTDRDRGH